MVSQQLPYRSELRARHAITGEATPYHISHSHALERIRRTVPNAKLLIMLQNPIYKQRGIYIDQSKPSYDVFSPNQILLLQSEELFGDTERVMADVYALLGVDSTFVPENLAPRNAGRYSAEIDAGLQQYLGDYFAPHNLRLYDFLQRDLGW